MTRRISPQTTLDHLKKEAKRWLKALHTHNPEARARFEHAIPQAPTAPTLRHVHLALAHEYGLSGWTELKKALASGSLPAADTSSQLVDRFLEYACPDHHVRGGPAHSMARGAALRLLEQHPEIANASFETAIVCGDVSGVARFLRESPELARSMGVPAPNSRSGDGKVEDIEKDLAPKHWAPLLFLCFTRLALASVNENAVAIARLLLDHGADPNAYFMAGGSIYTPLVGAIGEGEEDRPAHPCRDELVRLLLERAAKSYDIQVVYNIHFKGKVLWYLKLMHEFSVKAGHDADWADAEWHMLDMGGYGTGARWHLWIAVKHNDLELAKWCLSHGASPNAGPARAQSLPQCSLYESAARVGQMEMVDLFARYGARRIELPLDDEDAFVAASMRLDGARMRQILADHPEYLQSAKALFQAAQHNRTDVVRLLLDLGVPVDVEDGDKQHALHIAAGNDALEVAELLVERRAEIDPVEKNWSATPFGYAMWGNRTRMIAFLAPRSRNLWNLVFTGYVDRVRELLSADPQLGRSNWESSLLFSLPDDEAKAVEIVELFLSLGADASFRREDGKTAADVARRRGLNEAAAKLDADRYENLADDLIHAYDTGDPDALARLNQHYHQSLTWDDLRAQVWRRVYAARHAGGSAGALDAREARLLMARTAGFSNWELFMESVAKGTPPPEAPYVIDQKEKRIGPRRLLTPDEWDLMIAQMNEHRITRFDAHGYATDAALERIARLEHVTSLDLSGSREVSDDGLMHLARMPQLEYLNLGEYPGGKLTDRGLEFLCHLPELRNFEMTWQGGITDRGAGNLRTCQKLERVNLMGSPTGDGVIDALRGKPSLRDFSTGRLVTDSGLSMLHDFPMFRHWHELGDPESTRLLIDGPFSNEGFAKLADLDGIYELDLFWHATQITTGAFEALPRLANLGALGCDGKLADNRAMQFFAAIPRLCKLRAQGSIATDDGFIALSRSTTLEDIWGREAPNLTGRGFAAFSKMPSLRKLGISLKGVDDEALSLLPRFPALCDLTPIDLLDDGFRHVGECDRLERLVFMYCRDTTDAATDHIRNLNIRDYYAGKTKITDRSLEILGGMESLEKIEFWECAHVTDAGLPFLAALPNLREIEFGAVPGVTVRGTSVFPNSVRVHYWT